MDERAARGQAALHESPQGERQDTDQSLVRLRWPFAAALVLLLGGLAAHAAQPHLAAWWALRQADKQFQAEVRHLHPAVSALNRMSPVPGMAPCGGRVNVPVRIDGLECLVGDGQVLPTAVALVHSLETTGATITEQHCIRLPHLGILCRIKATIERQEAVFSVGPQLTDHEPSVPHGVTIRGGLGIWAFAPLPRHAPAVALPS